MSVQVYRLIVHYMICTVYRASVQIPPPLRGGGGISVHARYPLTPYRIYTASLYTPNYETLNPIQTQAHKKRSGGSDRCGMGAHHSKTMNAETIKRAAGLGHPLRRCAICLLSIGFGSKSTVRLTGIPRSTVKRISAQEKIHANRRKTIALKHVIKAATQYRRVTAKPEPKLELFEFKGEGKEWGGFELFESRQPQPARPQFSDEVEEWRTIPGYSMYECSSMGRFRNSKSMKLLQRKVHQSGYQHVGLIKDETGKQQFRLAHRVIAECFLGNQCGDRDQVNHINRIRNDNRVSNLEWCTRSENAKAWRDVSKSNPIPRAMDANTTASIWDIGGNPTTIKKGRRDRETQGDPMTAGEKPEKHTRTYENPAKAENC